MPYVSGFLPSRSAPLFHNGPWPAGLDLRISLAGLPAASIDVTQMGLCGGMSFLARDIHESGTRRALHSSRGIPLPLGRHILSRLLDSFLGPGVIPYWIHATQELDHGTWFWGKGLYAETVDAARQVMRYVDAGGLRPDRRRPRRARGRGTSSRTTWSSSTGTTSWATLTLHVYDSNYEGSDNVTITLDIGSSAPARPILTNGTSMAGQSGHVRGFFVLPYQRKDPSPAYVDDGQVTFAGTVPTSVTQGETLNLSVTIENTGSTTFESGRGYRLGTQSPADNTDWGTRRFELSERRPRPRRRSQCLLRAPLNGSPTLQLPLRESVHWFGQPTVAVSVTVSTPAAVG